MLISRSSKLQSHIQPTTKWKHGKLKTTSCIDLVKAKHCNYPHKATFKQDIFTFLLTRKTESYTPRPPKRRLSKCRDSKASNFFCLVKIRWSCVTAYVRKFKKNISLNSSYFITYKLFLAKYLQFDLCLLLKSYKYLCFASLGLEWTLKWGLCQSASKASKFQSVEPPTAHFSTLWRPWWIT